MWGRTIFPDQVVDVQISWPVAPPIRLSLRRSRSTIEQRIETEENGYRTEGWERRGRSILDQATWNYERANSRRLHEGTNNRFAPASIPFGNQLSRQDWNGIITVVAFSWPGWTLPSSPRLYRSSSQSLSHLDPCPRSLPWRRLRNWPSSIRCFPKREQSETRESKKRWRGYWMSSGEGRCWVGG